MWKVYRKTVRRTGETYKFDLEIKDKGHIGAMNVRDTSYPGDTPVRV